MRRDDADQSTPVDALPMLYASADCSCPSDSRPTISSALANLTTKSAPHASAPERSDRVDRASAALALSSFLLASASLDELTGVSGLFVAIFLFHCG